MISLGGAVMKRTVKILLSLVLIFSLLTSALFIVFNTEHNCSVENCCICAKIEAAFGIMKLLVGSFALVAAARSLKSVELGYVISANSSDGGEFSPIALKVRLNN